MAIGCNIWTICLKLNWYFYGLSRMLQLPQFVWTLRSLVWVVFNNFLLIDATDRSKIGSDQKCLFFFTPFHFSRTLPLNVQGIFKRKSSRLLEFKFVDSFKATSNLDLIKLKNVTQYSHFLKNVLNSLISPLFLP